jgi:hypothetical protein
VLVVGFCRNLNFFNHLLLYGQGLILVAPSTSHKEHPMFDTDSFTDFTQNYPILLVTQSCVPVKVRKSHFGYLFDAVSIRSNTHSFEAGAGAIEQHFSDKRLDPSFLHSYIDKYIEENAQGFILVIYHLNLVAHITRSGHELTVTHMVVQQDSENVEHTVVLRDSEDSLQAIARATRNSGRLVNKSCALNIWMKSFCEVAA